MKMLGALPAVLLVLLLVGAVWGKLASRFAGDEPEVSVQLRFDSAGHTLFVMVPGLTGSVRYQDEWNSLAFKLAKKGDVAMVDYHASAVSNADAEAIARLINLKIQKQWERKQYQDVILVGNSLGALVARKVLLYSQNAVSGSTDTATSWSTHVRRLVLLAGMNRGWDLSGEKPADMRWYVYYLYSAALWFGNLTDSGRLLRQMESGSPFVANLRLDWMRWTRSDSGNKLETVQLLGDIDEIVSADDNADLRVSGQGDKFVWLKVRGTGHGDILNISETKEDLGEYRLDKFISAIDQPLDSLRWRSEEQPYTTDADVTHIIFVMHGIRDLGEWSSRFETDLQARVRLLPPDCNGRREKLAIASVRYGYFGMGQFLLRRDRQKYVRWFMDQYTETLARYPKADKIDFIGHSNGTYLLGGALANYPSMKVRRVVLGGSVLPQDYDWKSVFAKQQVELVRNYVADDDWVVALFPRFFEPPPMRWLQNDIGSAGFNGFAAGDAGPARQPVDNVKFIQGQHAAFLMQLDSIVDFLIPRPGAPDPVFVAPGAAPERTSPVLSWVSKWATWILWGLIAFALVWMGSRVSGAAGHLSAVALVFYLFLVFQVLRWV